VAVTAVVPLDGAALERGVEVLRTGGLVAVPSDVGYVVLADAFATDATRRLRAVDDRLTMLVRGPRQVIGVAEVIPEPAERLMAAFWPGPLGIICASAHGIAVELGGAAGTVTVRMPEEDLVHVLLTAVGPLACGTPTQSAEAASGVGRLEVALAIDAGRCAVRRVTVVDVSGGGARLVEHGAVPVDAVQAVVTGAAGWGGVSER
jgi:L-threonylcarbamoyladenylate synthase